MASDSPTPATAPTEAQTIANLALKSAQTTMHYVGTAASAFVIFPDKSIKVLESLGDTPRRKRAQVALNDTKSFVAYLKTHFIPDRTTVFGEATAQGGSFVSIIDYHDGEEQADSPGWGEHRVSLKLENTPEWSAWLNNNRREMTQEAFLNFIEDNLRDIISPEPADMLEMVALLQGTKTVNFRSGKNLTNGSIDLMYVEKIESTGGVQGTKDGAMRIPDKFYIGLCPFRSAEGVQVEARLRYKISTGGAISFYYLLDKPHRVIETAFLAARETIEKETKLTVLMGAGSVTPPPDLSAHDNQG